MSFNTAHLGRLSRFAWSSWSGLAAGGILLAVWQLGHEAYGAFILPTPIETFKAVWRLGEAPRNWDIAVTTIVRALEGFGAAVAIGATGGIAAGYSAAALRIARPLITLLLGVPPIAWIVLAMIWFGSTNGMVVTTVVIAALPVVFVGAAEGATTRHRDLDDMATAFGASPLVRFVSIALRHIAATTMPAAIIALGTAFKVAVMAEVLANTGGIGGALARARANLDVAEALAWVLIAIAALLAFEYALIQPIRSELERWREAARPWGIKQ